MPCRVGAGGERSEVLKPQQEQWQRYLLHVAALQPQTSVSPHSRHPAVLSLLHAISAAVQMNPLP